MDTDIALACLASGRAMLIGAECRRGVHACPPSSVGERTKRSMSGPPFALQVHLPTVACGATYLEEFQNNPEIYIADEMYAEVIMKNIVPFPLRFDFDSRTEVVRELEHP